MQGDDEMEGSLRNFYGRCTNFAAIALSIFAYLMVTAVIVLPALAAPAPASAADQRSRAATATTPSVNDGLSPRFEINQDDTATVSTQS